MLQLFHDQKLIHLYSFFDLHSFLTFHEHHSGLYINTSMIDKLGINRTHSLFIIHMVHRDEI